MDKNIIKIEKQDILQFIYFITAITQKQTSYSMQGALSSKGDLMGGIFDRWINIIPESIVFNKLIIPEIEGCDDVEIISDYYIYDPKTSGIAPDVIGIKISEKVIPFVVFNERWEEVAEMPQIEVKTFKKNQKMITLRDQNYDQKYLVMVESEFRIDYLLPFFEKSIFDASTHTYLDMDDSIFIKSNNENRIHSIDFVNTSDDSLGTITLLKVSTAVNFMKYATHCEGNVSIQRIDKISKNVDLKDNTRIPIIEYCDEQENGLFRFNKNWYEGIENNIPFYTKKTRSGSQVKFYYKTLDIYVQNIDTIKVIKKSLTTMYIVSDADTILNEYEIKKGVTYKIEFSMLDRSSNKGEEYFMQKSLVNHITDCKKELQDKIKNIVKGENYEKC